MHERRGRCEGGGGSWLDAIWRLRSGGLQRRTRGCGRGSRVGYGRRVTWLVGEVSEVRRARVTRSREESKRRSAAERSESEYGSMYAVKQGTNKGSTVLFVTCSTLDRCASASAVHLLREPSFAALAPRAVRASDTQTEIACLPEAPRFFGCKRCLQR